jgi:hypothetical protein
MRAGFVLLLVVLPMFACEERRADIGKDPAHASSSELLVPSPSSSASAAPSPSFSGRDPFKPPGDGGIGAE